MTLIQWIRDKLHLDPHLTQNELYFEFLRTASKLARKGKVMLYKGGYKTLEEVMYDPENHVFILVVQGRKIAKPKELREWFRDYKL